MNKTPLKILVIDDDEDIRGLYADVFRGANFEVSEAKDGLEGLEMINQSKPDVVFTGIIMPRMDGFMLLENLKKNVATATLPVVFSSHLGREEDEARAKALGAKDFIVRGMTPLNEVVDRIRNLFATSEYVVELDANARDAQKLAQELGISPQFVCGDNNEKKYALKLRPKTPGAKTFDAELVCL
jgi:two-component system chemotaxis response regulator CheY